MAKKISNEIGRGDVFIQEQTGSNGTKEAYVHTKNTEEEKAKSLRNGKINQ